MVLIFPPLIAAAAVALFPRPSHGITFGDPIGEYQKPKDATGRLNATADQIRRSTCPALNSLANIGVLERSGRNIQKNTIFTAIQAYFNLDVEVATAMLVNVPEIVSLNEFGAADHAISLTRSPAYYHYEPAIVNVTLVEDLLKRAEDGYLNAEGVGETYKNRIKTYEKDPEFNLTAAQKGQAFKQGSNLLLAFGRNHKERLSVEDCRTFLIDENFPSNWKPASKPITAKEQSDLAEKIREVAE